MKLKHITFNGYVFGQSGVQGFFGDPDEYRHHFLYRLIPGFSFKGMVFVAKTATWSPRIYPVSNTELRHGYKVKRLFPKSIWVSLKSFVGGYMLNAVGLANPGVFELLLHKKWQRFTDPFQISFAPMGATLEEKIEETRKFCRLLKNEPSRNVIYTPYAIQVNFSCPNTEHEQKQAVEEIKTILTVLDVELPGTDIIPKFDLTVSPMVISELKPFCSAFCIANAQPFRKNTYGAKFDWKKLFRNETSPLVKHFDGRFSGGLSGKPLFKHLQIWLAQMEVHDPTVKIIAGGGIMKKSDILALSRFSIVKGIALGSVAILRPWRIQSLIQYGNKIFSQRKN